MGKKCFALRVLKKITMIHLKDKIEGYIKQHFIIAVVEHLLTKSNNAPQYLNQKWHNKLLHKMDSNCSK